MKLFIWRRVLRDYNDGIAFAMADSVETAKVAILNEYAKVWEPGKRGEIWERFRDELEREEPEEYAQEMGGYLEGSA